MTHEARGSSIRPDRRVQRAKPNRRVQRATGLEGLAETHRPEGRIIASSGVCVVCGILGNSLSIYAYSCVYVFQVLARTVGRRRRDLYTLMEDL